jgi:exodeoxyribonuclease-3
MFKVASWNLNSIRSRLTHVTTWLQAREPDVLLLQELKGTDFPSEAFKSLGYESVAVTQTRTLDSFCDSTGRSSR